MVMCKFNVTHSALLVGALLMTPAGAQAAAGDEGIFKILNTSPLYSDASKEYPGCVAVNITTSPVNGKIDLLDSAGNVLKTSGETTIAAANIVEVDIFTYTGFSRCRFTINGGSDALRANATIFFYTGTYYQTYAISEAR